MKNVAAIVLVLLTACAPMSGAGSGKSIELDGTRWTLTSLSGQPPVAGSSVTLNFEQGRASGSAGCNQYQGPYTVTGSKLEFGMMAATKRACLERERNVQETAYLDALTKVTSFTASEERLVLHDAAGADLLEFSRQP